MYLWFYILVLVILGYIKTTIFVLYKEEKSSLLWRIPVCAVCIVIFLVIISACYIWSKNKPCLWIIFFLHTFTKLKHNKIILIPLMSHILKIYSCSKTKRKEWVNSSVSSVNCRLQRELQSVKLYKEWMDAYILKLLSISLRENLADAIFHQYLFHILYTGLQD